MNRFLLFFTLMCCAAWSCTKEKTDYEAAIDIVVPEYDDFNEVVRIRNGGYEVSIEALNGIFYKGYNEIRVKITSGQTQEIPTIQAVTFLPILTEDDGNKTSGPHLHDLVYQTKEQYFSGYAVFPEESHTDRIWELYIRFTIANQTYQAKQHVMVQEQPNKNLNMTSFTGSDNEQYFIALVSPQKPKVGENELIAGIYTFNKPTSPPTTAFPDPSQFSYTAVNDYTLLLDPRMPEPSMGNHSSPNNEDLTQQSDGLYHGVVHYTMTGNWALNFILLDQNGQTIKGTAVPQDFTPGVEGIRSELHLDILF